MKFLRIALVIAVAFCLSASAYAETQSVKVSGDLTVRGIWRDNYDYRSAVPNSQDNGVAGTAVTGASGDVGGMTGIVGGYYGPSQNWWMSQAEVQVDAELTDNVSTCIRLLNERDWNVQNKVITGNSGAAGTVATDMRPNGLGGYFPDPNEFQVNVDLAYVTLKNFVYCPLSVTIGRQDLWFGKGFVVGSNHVYNNWVNNTTIATGAGATPGPVHLNAPEYTAQTAFDSVKAVLDYDPWTITGLWANIFNNTIASSDGIDLWGVNVGYKFDCYKAEAEAYWFYKRDHSVNSFMVARMNNDVHTWGIRGSMDPIDCVTISGEAAVQGGAYTANVMQLATRERAAWALDVAAEYRGLMDCWAWKPKMGIEYILYSGDKNPEDLANSTTNAYTGWDPMFRGKFDSAIREFVGLYYASYDYNPRANWFYSSADASFTNQAQLVLSGSVQPMDCLTLKGNWNLFWTLEDYVVWPNFGGQQAAGFPFTAAGLAGDASLSGAVQKRGGFIGNELDMQAIWDYTEDVSFGLLMGWFFPNAEVYYGGNNATAQDIVATVKVSF